MLKLNQAYKSNSFDNAKEYFRKNHGSYVFFPPKSGQYKKLVVMPANSMPTEIDNSTIVLTEGQDSRITASVATNSSSNSMSPSRKITRDRTVLEKKDDLSVFFNAGLNSPQGSRSHQSAIIASVVAAYDLEPQEDLSHHFKNSYIQTSDKKIYAIKDVIGSGSHGEVYFAVDENGNQFAVKFSRTMSNEVDINAQNEAIFYRKLNLLTSPPLKYTAPETELNFFITPMHYFPGKTLSKYLTENPACPLEKRYELAVKLCFIVKKLHLKGIAHGDIKPENIIIDENDDLHLIDFECATKEMNAKKRYESTDIYKLPDHLQLTRHQSDLVALMRCLFMDDTFLTASKRHEIYRPTARDTAIFKTDDVTIATQIQEKIKPFLSTSGLLSDLTTIPLPKCAIDLACTLLLSNSENPRPIRTLTLAALEFETLRLEATTYAFQYASIEHAQQFSQNSNDTLALKQALRVISHQYSRLTKENIFRDNPFFKEACTLAAIDVAELKEIFYSKTPSGIATYASLYQTHKERNRPNEEEIIAKLTESGLLN